MILQQELQNTENTLETEHRETVTPPISESTRETPQIAATCDDDTSNDHSSSVKC